MFHFTEFNRILVHINRSSKNLLNSRKFKDLAKNMVKSWLTCPAYGPPRRKWYSENENNPANYFADLNSNSDT